MIPKDYERYEKTVTVSAVNFSSVWGNKKDTLEKIKGIISSAAQMGTNIIAFPELALSGYECGREVSCNLMPCQMHEDAAETIPGPSTEDIAILARRLDIYVLLGMPERDEKDPKVKHISVAVIGPEGIIGKYRKIQLGGSPDIPESICFRPGNEVSVFETRYGPIGVQICSDFWHFPELSRILWLKGARLLFNCSAHPLGAEKLEHISQTTVTRGHESHIYAISANMVGKERTISFGGHSFIAGPFPLESQRAFYEAGDEEEIVSATLSFEKLHTQSDPVKLKKRVPLEIIANEYQNLLACQKSKDKNTE